jgi:hypothetical protein
MLSLASPVDADDCWICDDVVEVNSNYAECYVSNFDLLMQSFEERGVERHQVNFAGCEGSEDTTSTRGGILKMGGLPESSPTSSKTVYTLSRRSAICLKDLIEDFEGELDPKIVFKLNEQCADE